MLCYAQKRKELSLSTDLYTGTQFKTTDRSSSIERAPWSFCLGKTAVVTAGTVQSNRLHGEQY